LNSVAGGKTNLVDYLNFDVPIADKGYGSYPDGAVANRRRLYYVTAAATNDGRPAPISVAINEWMADNTYTVADPVDGKFQDWFELFNYASEPADLGGYYLTDTLTDKTLFLVPPGYVIPPRGRLLVWADGEPTQNSPGVGDLHVNFSLSKSGEGLGLYSPERIEISALTFGKQTNDISQGRYPDGTGAIFYMTNATPRMPNIVGDVENTAPGMGEMADQFVWEGQLVNLVFTATEDDLPAQELTFSLEPGFPAGAVINADTGLFTWRTSAVTEPVTNSVTVRVMDSGLPSLSATRTIAIVVAPLPRSSVVGISGDTLSMSWNVYPGKRYQLQFNEGLETSIWLNMGDVMTPDTSSIILTDALDDERRFYRLIEAP
jgi:hypothetical protein